MSKAESLSFPSYLLFFVFLQSIHIKSAFLWVHPCFFFLSHSIKSWSSRYNQDPTHLLLTFAAKTTKVMSYQNFNRGLLTVFSLSLSFSPLLFLIHSVPTEVVLNLKLACQQLPTSMELKPSFIRGHKTFHELELSLPRWLNFLLFFPLPHLSCRSGLLAVL